MSGVVFGGEIGNPSSEEDKMKCKNANLKLSLTEDGGEE